MAKIHLIGIALATGALIAGCGKSDSCAEAKPEAPKPAAEKEFVEEAVVTVNGEKLMRSQVRDDVEAIIKAQGDKVPAEQLDYIRQMLRNRVAQSFLVERVLVAKAKAAGLAVTDADRKAREDEVMKNFAGQPDAPKSMDEYFAKFPLGAERAKTEFENGILIDMLIKAEMAKDASVDYAAEAKKTIDGIVARNAASSNALPRIQALKAELDKLPADQVAAKFAELAKANSDCPSSAKGGDLGKFGPGQMVKEFDEAAFALPVGKVSDPVKTQFGYHLILTTAKFPAEKDKDGKETAGEQVQASHILIKAEQQKVPTEEEVIKFLKGRQERDFVGKFIQAEIRKADVQTSDDFKQLLPPPEEKNEAVEKPAEK